MSVWKWLIEFNNGAEAKGDRDALRLLQIYENASKFTRTDPDVMLGLLAEGRAWRSSLRSRGGSSSSIIGGCKRCCTSSSIIAMS